MTLGPEVVRACHWTTTEASMPEGSASVTKKKSFIGLTPAHGERTWTVGPLIQGFSRISEVPVKKSVLALL